MTPPHPSAPSSGLPSQGKIPTLSEVSTSSSDTGGDSLSSEDEQNREYENIVVEEEDIYGSDSEDEGDEERLSMLEKTINQQQRFLQTLLEQQTEFQQQLGVIVQSIPKTNTWFDFLQFCVWVGRQLGQHVQAAHRFESLLRNVK